MAARHFLLVWVAWLYRNFGGVGGRGGGESDQNFPREHPQMERETKIYNNNNNISVQFYTALGVRNHWLYSTSHDVLCQPAGQSHRIVWAVLVPHSVPTQNKDTFVTACFCARRSFKFVFPSVQGVTYVCKTLSDGLLGTHTRATPTNCDV